MPLGNVELLIAVLAAHIKLFLFEPVLNSFFALFLVQIQLLSQFLFDHLDAHRRRAQVDLQGTVLALKRGLLQFHVVLIASRTEQRLIIFPIPVVVVFGRVPHLSQPVSNGIFDTVIF